MGRGDLAGAAHLELVSGVLQLRPEDAMFEAMLRGWKAQQVARGLREDTIAPRERLVRRFLEFTNEYPWSWGPSHVDEWTQALTSERRLAPGSVDDPRLSDGPAAVQRVPVRRPLRVGSRLREGIRSRVSSGAGLP